MSKILVAIIVSVGAMISPAIAFERDGLMAALAAVDPAFEHIERQYGECLPECNRDQFAVATSAALGAAWPQVFDQMIENPKAIGTSEIARIERACLDEARSRIGDDVMRNHWVPPVAMLATIDPSNGNRGMFLLDFEQVCPDSS